MEESKIKHIRGASAKLLYFNPGNFKFDIDEDGNRNLNLDELSNVLNRYEGEIYEVDDHYMNILFNNMAWTSGELYVHLTFDETTNNISHVTGDGRYTNDADVEIEHQTTYITNDTINTYEELRSVLIDMIMLRSDNYSEGEEVNLYNGNKIKITSINRS